MSENGRDFRPLIAELIGSFALVFAGCGSIMVAERFPGAVAPGAVPVVFGLVVASMIYAVGHISGAHFNPAVTAGFAVVGRFPKRDVLPYWAAQFLGAVAAESLLVLLLPAGHGFGATIPSVPWLAAAAWEAILTFFLMFVIISVATDTRAHGPVAGIAIGATVCLDAFFGGPVTGASMNPARSLAPALFQGTLPLVWIYVAGPMAGSVAAAFTYESIR
jgi:MIP family channel proteins